MQSNDEILINLDDGYIQFRTGDDMRTLNGKGLGICDDVSVTEIDGVARLTISFEAKYITMIRGGHYTLTPTPEGAL